MEFVDPWNNYDKFSDFYSSQYMGLDNLNFQIIKRIAALEGGPILDLACGNGRTVIELAKLGYEITGVDISKEMLKKCKEQIDLLDSNISKNVSLKKQALQLLDLKQKNFGTAICLISLQYMKNNKELVEVFSRIKKHLKPKGIFFFEHSNLDRLYTKYIGSDTDEYLIEVMREKTNSKDGHYYRITKIRYFKDNHSIGYLSFPGSSEISPEEFLNNKKLLYDYTQKTKPYFSTRNLIKTKENFIELLEKTGFKVLKTFGSNKMETFDPKKSISLYVLAESVD